jgi:hypothetical protein
MNPKIGPKGPAVVLIPRYDHIATHAGDLARGRRHESQHENQSEWERFASSESVTEWLNVYGGMTVDSGINVLSVNLETERPRAVLASCSSSPPPSS